MNDIKVEWQKFAMHCGISLEKIIDIAEFIDAPDDLYSIHSALKNFAVLINAAKNFDFPEFEELRQKLLNFALIVKQLNSTLDADIYRIPEIWKSHGTTRQKGLIGKHPIYAMLTNDNEQYSEDWFNLKAEYTLTMLYIVKSYRQLAQIGEIKKPNQNEDIGTRGVRKLEEFENREKIPPLPSNFENFNDFIEEFFKWSNSENLKWAFEFFAMANSLLEKKEGYSRRYEFKVDRVSRSQDISVDLNIRNHTQRAKASLNSDLPNDPSSKKILHLGNHPQEFKGELSLKLEFNRNDSTISDIKTHVTRTKAIENTILRDAQQLVSSSTDLTSRELEILIKELIDLTHRKDERFQLLKCGQYELCSLLFLAIFTGLSLQKIQTLRFAKFSQFAKSKTKELTWCHDTKTLYIPTHSNDVYSKMRRELKALIQINNYGEIPNSQTSYYSVTLPDFASLAFNLHYDAWQKLIVKKRSIENKTYAKTMAYLDFEAHPKAIKLIFKYLNLKFKTNLTFHKLSKNFRNAVFTVKNDQAIYTLITSQHHGHGIVSSHYYAIDRSKINEVHVDVINFILNSCSLKTRVNYDQFDIKTIGSKFPLQSETVRLFVKYLKSKINIAKRHDFVSYHNAYTTYIISMLGFATGYRAVCDPIHAKHQINTDFGFLTISDKDNESGFHSRTVPLTDAMLEQFLIYEDYLRHLKVKVINNKFTSKNISELLNKDIEKPKAPYFFFLNEKLRMCQVKPETLKAHLDPGWTFPPNINRHYLRTQLSNSDCNPEFIDYFLGHWELGEEPFNTFSFVSPQIIRENIVSHVEKMMKHDGWTVIGHPYA